ncbi:MAG: type IX secretion system sortase PorU [Bacteroidota bacterium]
MRYKRLLFLLLTACTFSLSAQIAEHSVLSQGTWYKLGVVETGMYKLDQAFLNSIGINTTGIDPRNIQIYGNGGGMLPQANSVAVHDDLAENAIYVEGESDGSFGGDDYVMFYAEGPHKWDYNVVGDQFRHQFNLYADTNYYYITVGAGPGKRVEEAAAPNASPTYTLGAGKRVAFRERDVENPLHSGRFWLGDKFDLNLQREFAMYVGDVASNGEIKLTMQFNARSDVNTNFSVSSGTTLLSSATLSAVAYDNSESLHYRTNRTSFTVDPSLVGSDDSLRIRVQFDKRGSIRSEGWLDWYELEYESNLSVAGQAAKSFSIVEQLGPDEIAELNLSGVNNSYRLWDITDPVAIRAIPFSLSGSNLNAKVLTEARTDLIAFNNASLVPVSVKSVPNQDLHGSPLVDYIIISYPGFLAEAQRLAQFHEDHYQRSTLVVTPQEIYEEFSSGRPDVTALRNFIRMFYRRSGGLSPGFVCMFGDGTFNHKKINVLAEVGEINFVPTYQSCNSWDPTDSYVSDDYFVLLEDNEGAWGEGCGRDGDDAIEINTIDVPIGRIPVISLEEATQMVDKIINYATNPDGQGFGNWRNRVLLVADHKEGEGSTHVRQADGYTSFINSSDPCINVDKVYMDNYPLEITAGKSRFPEGREALLTALDRGSLIVNYTGHGGEFAWSNSRIFENSDIGNLDNKNRLPVVVTATCEFGRYDNPDLRSGAELMLLAPDAGAIGLFTTVRLVYSSPNETLNRNFYRQVFTFDSTKNRMPTLGEVMMRTKNATFKSGSFSNLNSRNFTLMGDPGLILNYPELKARITEINNQPIQAGQIDTLQSLAKVSIRGIVEDANGNPMTNYNGDMDVTVFDKPSRFVTRLSNFNFFWQKNRLFNGKVTVENGAFFFEFVVPIDISYENGKGKISLYFNNGQQDGTGCYSDLFIGGTDPDAAADTQGPDVNLYMNDNRWRDGGVTGTDPYLYAEVFDQNGINTAGVGIGHEITAVMDDEAGELYLLNDYYQSEPNSYQRGTVRYQLKDLAEGPHSLKIRVWDVANNFAEDETNFIVTSDPVAVLDQVMNYPNPFGEEPTTFLVSHNLDGKDVKLKIVVSSLNGQIVKVLEDEFYAVGNVYEGATWDGKSANGNPLANGMYIYRVLIEDVESGRTVEAANRLVLLR